jgi:tRNA 2-thiouridine synthesizing protein A
LEIQNLWDAGDLGCGELIIELHKKMKKMQSGEIIEVIAQDKGAIEDLPAWSRMTGNKIIKMNHPNYFFQKK